MLPEIKKKKICVSLLPLTENKKKRKKLCVSLSPLAEDKKRKEKRLYFSLCLAKKLCSSLTPNQKEEEEKSLSDLLSPYFRCKQTRKGKQSRPALFLLKHLKVASEKARRKGYYLLKEACWNN